MKNPLFKEKECPWCTDGEAPSIQKKLPGLPYWFWGNGKEAKYVCPNHKTEPRPKHLM